MKRSISDAILHPKKASTLFVWGIAVWVLVLFVAAITLGVK